MRTGPRACVRSELGGECVKGRDARGAGLEGSVCCYDCATDIFLSQGRRMSRQRPRQTNVGTRKKSGATNIYQTLLHTRCGVAAMRQWFGRDASNRASTKFWRGREHRENAPNLSLLLLIANRGATASTQGSYTHASHDLDLVPPDPDMRRAYMAAHARAHSPAHSPAPRRREPSTTYDMDDSDTR